MKPAASQVASMLHNLADRRQPAILDSQAAGAALSPYDWLVFASLQDVCTDALAVEGMASAVGRARACVEAGADMIFPEAMQTLEPPTSGNGKGAPA